jgi:hypothetical protein
MLHVTNGDSAAARLRAADVGGDVLPWRDVLHEGPVPAGLDAAALRGARARFLAEHAGVEPGAVLADLTARDARLDAAIEREEPIVLWFETDLYDVLQLAQILDRLPAGRARLVLVGEHRFRGVAELPADELRTDAGRTVSAELTAAARSLWAAFRAPDPAALAPLAAGTPALPALGEAARRHLQQYPWRGSGLNRTERTLLEAVAAGARTPVDAFLAHQDREERPFMGDATAFVYLRSLAAGPAPLLENGDGLRLTAQGNAVLAGRGCWDARPERWLGGVRLAPGPPRWHYEPAAGRLVAVS